MKSSFSQCNGTGCAGCAAAATCGRKPVKRAVLVGNLNVGKSALFSRLTGVETHAASSSGSSFEILNAPIPETGVLLFDPPGTSLMFANSDEEVVYRDALLMEPGGQDGLGLVMVADVKNLKRTVALALQYAEYGLPMAMAVNMMDEAPSRGIQVDLPRLEELLGIDVYPTVAREGIGLAELAAGLPAMRVPTRIPINAPRIEEFIEAVGRLVQPSPLSPRILGVLLLTGDKVVERFIVREFGPGMLQRLRDLVAEFRPDSPTQVAMTLSTLYLKKAEQIVNAVVEIEPPSKSPFIRDLGEWCVEPRTGIPIAFLVMLGMYLFVGTFGAGFVAGTIEEKILLERLIPWVGALLQPIPIAFLRDLIIDPDFGVFPTGIALAIGLVAPVMFCFNLAFGLLEDSGYLPRLSVLLDRVFRLLGLNGKGVIPLLMGFSCVTMAIMTTRVLDTNKEKNIASFLPFLAVPCAPLMAVMFSILDKMPFHATVALFGIILLQVFLAGYLADRALPGARVPLLLEIPPMRLPKLRLSVRSAVAKTSFFVMEAVPVFILAAVVVFVFQRLGGLQVLEHLLRPLTGTLLGLPENSIQVFIKTMIRRESGAAELMNLSSHYSNLQLVVCLLVMTITVPCLNSVIILYKERGKVAATAMIVIAVTWSILVGTVVNHACLHLGISFQ